MVAGKIQLGFQRTKLPSETLLDALQFLDYDSVVTLKFVSSRFLDLAEKCLEQYRTAAVLLVVVLEENAIRVFCPAEKKTRNRVALCHRTESYSTCDDWSCSSVHIAEAAVKFRALLGFNQVYHVQIHADWNDAMMGRLLTVIPMLKSARMITIGQRNGVMAGLADVVPVPLQSPQWALLPPPYMSRVGSATLFRFLGHFDDVATLWVHGVDEVTFNWKTLRDPKILRLDSLRLMNLREEPNLKETVRYCSQLASNTSSYRRLALLGAPLGKAFVKEISRVVDVAMHEVSVQFESAVEIASDDVAFDTLPPYDLSPSAGGEGDTIKVLATRHSAAFLLHVVYNDGQECYVISNQKKQIEIERHT